MRVLMKGERRFTVLDPEVRDFSSKVWLDNSEFLSVQQKGLSGAGREV